MHLDGQSAGRIQRRRHLFTAVSHLEAFLQHDLFRQRRILFAHIQILIIGRTVIWFRIQGAADDALEHEHLQVRFQKTPVQPDEAVALHRLDRVGADRHLLPLRLQIFRKVRKTIELII